MATKIRDIDILPDAGMLFLKRCYRFVNQEWQHADRETSPDQGFERRFRENCIQSLVGWTISDVRELRLGGEFDTASGILHEIDIVANHNTVIGIAELKNKIAFPADKNDVIVFFAKMLDYLLRNPPLAQREIVPVFMSTVQFESTGVTACLGLGIHPVAPGLRPFPILISSGLTLERELTNGLSVANGVRDRFDDFCARLNNVGVMLADSWMTSRCGWQADDRIVLRAVPSYDSSMLSGVLRQLNSDCTSLLAEVRAAKAGMA